MAQSLGSQANLGLDSGSFYLTGPFKQILQYSRPWTPPKGETSLGAHALGSSDSSTVFTSEIYPVYQGCFVCPGPSRRICLASIYTYFPEGVSRC